MKSTERLQAHRKVPRKTRKVPSWEVEDGPQPLGGLRFGPGFLMESRTLNGQDEPGRQPRAGKWPWQRLKLGRCESWGCSPTGARVSPGNGCPAMRPLAGPVGAQFKASSKARAIDSG